MHKTTRTAVGLTVAALGLVGGGLQVTAAGASTADDTARRGVCAGVHDCSVVGRFDVNGNGRPDRVGLVNHDRDGFIRKGRVTVRVKTDHGRLIRQRVVVKHWRGAVWHGAAAINGRRGVELVVGANRNKYVQFDIHGDPQPSFAKGFHVLTFKPGSDLSTARTPAGAKVWWLTSQSGVRTGHAGETDSFYYEWGWWRTKVNGEVRIQKHKISTGGAAGVVTRKTVWAWRHGDWRQVGTGSPGPDSKYGGWHARGLPVW